MHKLFIIIALTSFILAGCSSRHPSLDDHSSLHIAISEDPTTLDPRLSRDLLGSTVVRMLYEGLTRIDNEGKIVPAVADKIDVSDDGLTYTFHLRNALWSDGSPVTANDFYETWKSVLDPKFPSPNAYQLFVIQGAKSAKEGKLPFDAIGVKAPDPHTLIVKLERPAPYFLELTSCPFFYPVHKLLRDEKTASDDKCIVNGPFILRNWERRNELNVVKNLNYWDAAHVALPGISLYTLDENTALVLYRAKALDWVGSPLSILPQDSIDMLKAQGQLEFTQGAGTHWFRLNTAKAPFTSNKMRRAFALAVNRNAIVDHVTQGNQKEALAVVPPALGWLTDSDLEDNAVQKGQELFEAALTEMGITKDNLPKITLSYSASDRNHKIAQAVQQQWNKTFGIDVSLESSESQVLRDRMTSGNYQIALGSWFADYRDPINFLEIFKSKLNATNQTFWEHDQYTDLIEKSFNEKDPAKRGRLLSEAEMILINEMPVIPLFYSAYNFLKVPGIAGVYFSPLGYLDFKDAYFIVKPSVDK